MIKSIVNIVFFVSLISAIPAFGIEAMTEDVMKKTTGQASVSIQVDNVVVEGLRLNMLYIDDDGATGSSDDAAGIAMKYTQGIRTYRAIFDYTDRGGYLQREYGTLMRRDALNGGEAHWTGLDIATGGEAEPSPMKIRTTKKLPLHSYMKAFNTRGSALAEAVEAYNTLKELDIDYSFNETENINTIMDATGMDRKKAAEVYAIANTYVNSDQTDADRLATEIALQNISVSGVEITLPTLETFTDYSVRTYTANAEGAVNDGAEYATITQTGNVTTILGGKVEICTGK